MDRNELVKEHSKAVKSLEKYKKMGIELNMARGLPNKKVVDYTASKFSEIDVYTQRIYSDGVDLGTYNQNLLAGIKEARKLFGEILSVPYKNVIVGGNSSLNLMFDLVSHNMLLGNCDSDKPWSSEKIKFLCPAPGYDRHFAICEFMNIEMINVSMTSDGPDMNLVEDLVANDPKIKGIWCVPMYSNPTGCVYSDETVKRLAAMKTAAKDFRIFWDHAYCVHHLYNKPKGKILNILEEEKKAGNENRTYVFSSTSKISMPGTGISALASSMANINNVLERMKKQTIGYDKINMIRHTLVFPDRNTVESHMKNISRFIRPNFEIVNEILTKELNTKGIAKWSEPAGGYFINFDAHKGCAKKIISLCEETGVKLTSAGATFPYRKDPNDSNIRIAPTYPTNEEIRKATEIFTTCVKIATLEKLMEDK